MTIFPQVTDRWPTMAGEVHRLAVSCVPKPKSGKHHLWLPGQRANHDDVTVQVSPCQASPAGILLCAIFDSILTVNNAGLKDVVSARGPGKTRENLEHRGRDRRHRSPAFGAQPPVACLSWRAVRWPHSRISPGWRALWPSLSQWSAAPCGRRRRNLGPEPPGGPGVMESLPDLLELVAPHDRLILFGFRTPKVLVAPGRGGL